MKAHDIALVEVFGMGSGRWWDYGGWAAWRDGRGMRGGWDGGVGWGGVGWGMVDGGRW